MMGRREGAGNWATGCRRTYCSAKFLLVCFRPSARHAGVSTARRHGRQRGTEKGIRFRWNGSVRSNAHAGGSDVRRLFKSSLKVDLLRRQAEKRVGVVGLVSDRSATAAPGFVKPAVFLTAPSSISGSRVS